MAQAEKKEKNAKQQTKDVARSIEPQPGIIIIELLKIKSKIEKDLKKKSPELIITKESIQSRMKHVLESSGNTLEVWDEHPDQGIIYAIGEEMSNERGSHSFNAIQPRSRLWL